MAIQLSLESLRQSVSLDSWKQRIVDIATSIGLDTQNWGEGGFTRLMVALFAKFYTASGDVIPIIASSHFLDFCEGAWLTLLAKQVYNVDRIEATYASGVEAITLTNSGGGLYIFDAGDVVVARTSTDKTYRSTSTGTLPPFGTLKLNVAAEEPGTDSNAPVGTITTMVTTFIGVTVTNTIALVGLDEQSDPDLRQLCRDSVAARSIGGVKKAYEFYSKTARRANGSPIGVTRVRVPPAVGDGTGAVYIAGAGGAISSPDVDIVQDVYDVTVTPHGFNATALSAVNKSISAPCTIWIPSSLGISAADAKDKVAAALTTYVTTAPISGYVIDPTPGRIYWRALLGVIANAIPGTLKVQLTSETDIAIAGNEVPVWGGAPSDTTVNLVT